LKLKRAEKQLKPKPSAVKKDPESGSYSFLPFRKARAAAAFSSRRFKIDFRAGSNASVVTAHRRHFCDRAGVPFRNLVTLEQVHGANIVRVGMKEAGNGSRSNNDWIRGSDAVLTNESELVLSIRTADCAPVFFLDPARVAIGLAHIGWRGASEHLASKMVQAFRSQFLSKPGDLLIGIGPMIRACCYQVGEEFQGVFGKFVAARDQKLYFDLTAWIKNELKSEGILANRLIDSRLCSACLNDQFPSFRKEGENAGRTLSVLALM
jgi:YfiH family protein